MANWLPLSRRTGPEEGVRERESLHEGIPAWLVNSLVEWMHPIFIHYDRATGEQFADKELLLEIERELETPLDWADDPMSTYYDLEHRLIEDSGLFLDVLDFLVSKEWASELHEPLEKILLSGRSVWRCNSDASPAGLERRLDEPTMEATQSALDEGGRAGDHLAVSHRHLYGLQPNFNTAYFEAVRAVEAAGRPIIAPNDPAATLGRLIGEMRSFPERWVVDLPEGVETVLGMMRTLWFGHHRHGDPDETVRTDHTKEEAEAAFYFAIALCRWFSEGFLRPA